MKNFLRRFVLSNPLDYEALKAEALDLLLNMASEANLTVAEMQQKKAMLRFGITAFQHVEIQALLLEIRDGYPRKIPAIKLMREYAHLGLKEAKDAVENNEYFAQRKQ